MGCAPSDSTSSLTAFRVGHRHVVDRCGSALLPVHRATSRSGNRCDLSRKNAKVLPYLELHPVNLGEET